MRFAPPAPSDAAGGHRSSAQPWRAPDTLGARDGLRTYQQELRSGGAGRLMVAAATFAIARKVVGMAARGMLARPRFRSVNRIPLIGRHVRLSGLKHVEAGVRFRVEDYAEIHGTSREGLRFGDNVTIGAFAVIRPSNGYGRNLGVGLDIGDRSSIGPRSYLGSAGRVSIGSDVMLGPGVMIFGASHVNDSVDRTIKSQGVEATPVVIGDDCWIGAGAIITGGVTVGSGSIVGAGSIVTRDVPQGSVVAGNPARAIRKRTP